MKNGKKYIKIEDVWKYPTESVIRFVARLFYNSNRKDIKILDFGCGQGAHTWYLAREGFDTYAFDGSISAVEKAKELLISEGLNANFEVVDGINIKYQNDFFDAVIDSACIGHNKIGDITTMYLNIYNILKEGGYLYTSFFSKKTTGYGTGENTYKNVTMGPLRNLGIIHFWEENEFRGIIDEIGFKQIEIERYYHTDRDMDIDSYVLTAKK